MFKRCLIFTVVAVMFLAISSPVLAFWEYEPHAYMLDGEMDERVSIFTSSRINDTYGTFGWMIISQYFASGYGGLLYNPTPWLEVGFGAGVEQSDDPYYLGGSIGSFGEKYMAQAIFEHGGDHYWYSFEAMYRIYEYVSIGGISQRFDGTGPQVRLHYKNASIYVAPMFRAWEESAEDLDKMLMGITFSF